MDGHLNARKGCSRVTEDGFRILRRKDKLVDRAQVVFHVVNDVVVGYGLDLLEGRIREYVQVRVFQPVTAASPGW
jgi:hypothetical protein